MEAGNCISWYLYNRPPSGIWLALVVEGCLVVWRKYSNVSEGSAVWIIRGIIRILVSWCCPDEGDTRIFCNIDKPIVDSVTAQEISFCWCYGKLCTIIHDIIIHILVIVLIQLVRVHNWTHITILNHNVKFIKDYLLAYSFHSIEEFFSAEISQIVFEILSKFWYKYLVIFLIWVTCLSQYVCYQIWKPCICVIVPFSLQQRAL